MPYCGQDWRGPGGTWRKTDSGWRESQSESSADTSTRTSSSTFTLTSQTRSTTGENGISEWQPLMRHVQGVSKERRTLLGLSEAFLKMEISEMAVQVSGFCFCAEVFRQLMRQKFDKLSGTFKTYMFKTVEGMLDTALCLEFHVPVIQPLLQTASGALDNPQMTGIGGAVLRKKHQEKVNNMISKINRFEYSQPDESQFNVLDLPKECLQKIILCLPDHRDIVRLGSTCSYLHELTQDPFIWREMCLYQFSDKQLYPYADNAELNEVYWLEIYKLCIKKVKVPRCSYGNQMVICNNCRTVFWRMQGHPCSNPEKEFSCSLMTPDDFINLFSL